MAQWIKVLALQALGPDLSSNPQNPHKSWTIQRSSVYNPSIPTRRRKVKTRESSEFN